MTDIRSIATPKPRASPPLDPLTLAALAKNDVVSRQALSAAGFGSPTIREAQNRGQLVRLFRGWYATVVPRSAEEAHRLHVTARLQQYGDGVRAGGPSALVLAGLPTWALEPGAVTLNRLSTRCSQQRTPGLVVNTWPLRDTPADELADARWLAWCVASAGQRHPLGMLIPASAALRRRMVDSDDLDWAVTALGRRRAAASLRRVVGLADARHESVAETLAAWVFDQIGVDVEPQFSVPGTEALTPSGLAYRTDFRVRGTRVLIEVDGAVKYLGEDGQQARAVVYREKLREDRIRALGWVVVRFSWSDLLNPQLVRRRLEDAVRASGEAA